MRFIKSTTKIRTISIFLFVTVVLVILAWFIIPKPTQVTTLVDAPSVGEFARTVLSPNQDKLLYTISETKGFFILDIVQDNTSQIDTDCRNIVWITNDVLFCVATRMFPTTCLLLVGEHVYELPSQNSIERVQASGEIHEGEWYQVNIDASPLIYLYLSDEITESACVYNDTVEPLVPIHIIPLAPLTNIPDRKRHFAPDGEYYYEIENGGFSIYSKEQIFIDSVEYEDGNGVVFGWLYDSKRIVFLEMSFVLPLFNIGARPIQTVTISP